MKEAIYTALITIVSAAITTILLPALASWLKSKTNNQKLQSVITDLEVTAGTCVNHIEQTMVRDFKDDGKWDKAAEAAALDAAVTEMLNSLTQQTLEYLRKDNTDAEAVATRYIQSYIASLK